MHGTQVQKCTLLDINSIWRSKRGVFNFVLSLHLTSPIFCSFYTSEKIERTINREQHTGKTLISGVETGNTHYPHRLIDTSVIPTSVINLQKFSKLQMGGFPHGSTVSFYKALQGLPVPSNLSTSPSRRFSTLNLSHLNSDGVESKFPMEKRPKIAIGRMSC